MLHTPRSPSFRVTPRPPQPGCLPTLFPIQTDIVSRAAHELLGGGPGMPDWWLSEASDFASQPQTLDQWAAAEKPPLP